MVLRPCLADGCPEPVRRGYCDAHAPARRRSPSSKVTGTRAWRVVRGQVLRRDEYVCHYCGLAATTVDHVVPVSRGGAELDPGNLVASCGPCNAKKGGR